MHHRFLNPNRRGFSLIEILVAVGILVALTAIALPMILLSRKRGFEIRTRSDLALIGMALEWYKTDFGDYPRFDDSNAADATAAGQSIDPLNIQQDRGARLLCRALLSPGGAALPASAAGTTIGFDASKSTEQAPDGADGPGFRLRPGGFGKVYGPYLDASKFKLGNPGAPGGVWDSTYYKDATLLDQSGHSILYFPGFQQAVIKTNYVRITYTLPAGATAAVPPTRFYYDPYDNAQYGSVTTGNTLLFWKQIAYILGDRNLDGGIGTGESPTTTAPYLLWTAGNDGVFGFASHDTMGQPSDPTTLTADKLKTDDVTNFDIPSDLRK